MKTAAPQAAIVLAVASLLFPPTSPAADEEWFEGWELEANIAQAHLVLVARVASVSQLTVVEGAKTSTSIREYRFQPVRTLKGVFSRDELSMTGSDLGCPVEDGVSPPPFRQGELRLLILAQQQGGFVGCVSAASGPAPLQQQVPLLAGVDDPIVSMAEMLARVTDERSRARRAEVLLEALEKTSGPAAVPLLGSLVRRASWAARSPRAVKPLARLAADPSPAVRAAAVAAIAAVLAGDPVKENAPLHLELAAAVKAFLESSGTVTASRIAALRALGHLGEHGRKLGWPAKLLVEHLQAAPTRAERRAAAAALGELRDPAATGPLLEAFSALPLDEDPGLELAHARAAAILDRDQAAAHLLARLEKSIAERQPFHAEVHLLGCLQPAGAVPLLLAAARSTRLVEERPAIARAFALLRDERAVPVLGEWLRGQDGNLREAALAALEAIDTKTAAAEARLWIKSEPFLPYKLRLARILGRHGIADGYSLAIEHLADEEYTALAARALEAIHDARTKDELLPLLRDHRDRRWRAAALAGLVAVADAAGTEELTRVLRDDRNPIVVEAAAAAGMSNAPEVVPLLGALVKSRNRRIALAALASVKERLRRLKGAGDDPPSDCEFLQDQPVPLDESEPGDEGLRAVAEALRAVLLDAYVDEAERLEALRAYRHLKDKKFGSTLQTLADQSELEGTSLLSTVEREVRRHRIRLEPPPAAGKTTLVKEDKEE